MLEKGLRSRLGGSRHFVAGLDRDGRHHLHQGWLVLPLVCRNRGMKERTWKLMGLGFTGIRLSPGLEVGSTCKLVS